MHPPRTSKSIVNKVLSVSIMIVAILLLFLWYSSTNSSRIKTQNLNYAMSTSRQTVRRVEGEFNNALLRLRNYCYLLERRNTPPEITAEFLEGIEENASFDNIRFTFANGQNLSSDGRTNDSSDRSYFLRGMEGESGLDVVTSRQTGQLTMVFFSPVEYGGERIGLLLGLYNPEEYLREMLSTIYFGEPAQVYLCDENGRSIASSSEQLPPQGMLLDALVQEGVIDSDAAQGAKAVFTGALSEYSSMCSSECLTDNLCAMRIPGTAGTEYILVQTFPKSVTQSMLNNANHAGMVLQAFLIGIFFLYIVILLLQARIERKALEKQNTQYNYVLEGLNRYFSSSYVTVNLKESTYSTVSGIGTWNTRLAAEGPYDEILQDRASEIVSEEEQERFRQTFRLESIREIMTKQDSFIYECHVLRNGQEDWENLVCVCLDYENGVPVHVLYFRQNIAELVRNRQKQTKALQEALLQAQHASKSKSTFLSNMSHDIRTPMNAIIGFTTLAASHIDNKERVQECLQKVLSSSNHLLSLINDILDMSRIESGKIQINEQPCNISELTHNLVNIIQPQVKAKQLDLFIDTFNVVNENIIADSLKLSQVMVNLLSNAVKYTPAKGMVSFRIQQNAVSRRGYGNYVFIVKDSGVGMSPEFLEHVFEPFERELSATRSGIQGSGLGLAITKNIVDMMGGTITASSEKGKGSEFRVELSLKIEDVQKVEAQIQELEGLRALVVDNDCGTCENVAQMLTQIGLRSEWTTSGREAVYRAKQAYQEDDAYHTYIIDWQMPEMNGVETCRQIRAAVDENVSIIIMTAYDWTDIEEEAKAAGVTAFCAKPLFMSDLKSALLVANNMVKPSSDEPSWTGEDFGGRRILLVEDNELNREIAQTILEEVGFVVECAPDGTDAVAMVSASPEGHYDAVLMDVQMPVMDGYEATRLIRSMARKDVRDLPIIAMTANAMEDDKEAALNSGMNAHIAKPLNIQLFLDILGSFMK